jgi:hypothetical protein
MVLGFLTCAYAHHSLTGTYDLSRQVSVEGAVTKFEFINPHPFVTLAVEGARGDRQSWRLEMDNRFELMEIGVVSGTLKSGDRVVVTGNPGRTQAQSLYIRTLDRPADGLRIEQVESTPRIQLGTKR